MYKKGEGKTLSFHHFPQEKTGHVQILCILITVCHSYVLDANKKWNVEMPGVMP